MSIDDVIREALDGMAREVIERRAAAENDPLQLFGAAHVGKLLDVTADTAGGWLASGKIEGAFKVEGKWRVRRRDLERYIAAQEAATRGEPDEVEVVEQLARDMRGSKTAG